MAKNPTTVTKTEDTSPEYRVLATSAPTIPGDPTSAKPVMFHFVNDGDYRDAWKMIRQFLDKGGEVETMIYDPELAKVHEKSKDPAKGWKLSGQKVPLGPKEFKARNMYALQNTRGFQRGLTWKQVVEAAEEAKVTIPKQLADLVAKLEAERAKDNEAESSEEQQAA